MAIRAAPPILPSAFCAEYSRLASVEELDTNLSLLSHYKYTAAAAASFKGLLQQQRSTILRLSSEIADRSTDSVNISEQTNCMLTPPSTPEYIKMTHRWSASSVIATISHHQAASTNTAASSRNSTSQSSNSAIFEDLIEKLTPGTGQAPLASILLLGPSGQNVAIDNKIEQAMDLVKTHLTFAVREEVEVLRSTIAELEAKVAQLESQNQVLKQFAPSEVVESLALLVQQQQQKQLQQMQPVTTLTKALPSVQMNPQSHVDDANHPVIKIAQRQNSPLRTSESVEKLSVNTAASEENVESSSNEQQIVTCVDSLNEVGMDDSNHFAS